MKPLHHKTHTLVQRGLSLLCILALCLGLLPIAALAAGEDAPDTLYVGETQITGSGYWTTDDNGKLTASNENNYNVYYDGNGTLTLKNANIQGRGNINEGGLIDYGIYAASTSGQSVALTINLIGRNTVKGYCGICVDASGGGSTLVIQSDGNDPKGSLEAIGSGWNGITMSSDSGNVSLTINNASVEASTERTGYYGVSVTSNAGSPTISLTVNGGSLTAQGDSGLSGIRYFFQTNATNPSISLTVQNNAWVKAMPGIATAASMTSKPTTQGNGIIFDGTEGTVYGSVTLDESLTINEGESLTIPEGSTLNTNGNLTNNGTIVNTGGSLNGEAGGTIVTTPAITTESLPDGTVGQPYTATLEATGNNITWILNSGTLPAGLTLNSDGTITGTPSAEGSSTFTVKAENSAGIIEKTFTLNIKAAPVSVTSVKLDKTELPLVVGGNATLIATVEPADATDRTVTWESSDSDVATVDQSGNVKAVAPGTANITVKTVDGSHTDTCAVTVTQPVTGVTLDKGTLSLFTGESETLNATVAPGDATNKNVTWSSDKPEVATVDANGKITAKDEGEATITVRTADGSYTATCTVKVTDPVYDMTTDPAALDFGSAYTGYAQPAAQTVTLTNTGNQTVTLNQPVSTDNFEVGTLSKTTLAAGETATFTVQPKAGLAAGTYSENITVSGSENVTVTISASFTVKSRPSYNPPTVSEETTDAIKAADPGETVTVDLSSGSTKLDKEVFEALAGKDVTLVVDLGDGVSWTVKGTDVPENADFTDIDMGVTMNSDGIPVEVVNAITGERDSVQITLAHDGAFGFTMTLTAPLGAENAGYWANLYHFNEEANAMTFETAAPIGSDGSVSLSLSHASQYAIVIDDHNHGIVTLPFTDVSADDWFYDPVCYVYSQGLMTGTSATTFEPNTSLSRAMLVAVLHRLEGSPAASAGDFSDVASGDWYAQAVNWAASVGVVNGFDDGTFQPNAAITREQMAAILRNYAEYKGIDVTASGDLANYSDAASVSDWAKESVAWAVDQGLISGMTVDTLQPQGLSTRAQVAAVLQRYLAN